MMGSWRGLARSFERQKQVAVKFNDRREYKAKVIGSDPATDVAVLKIDANNLPVVQIGDPARLGFVPVTLG